MLSRQWPNRRLPDFETPYAETIARQERREEKGVNKIEWGFTTDEARVKLKRLYPPFQE